jgi:hypothetical protein
MNPDAPATTAIGAWERGTEERSATECWIMLER